MLGTASWCAAKSPEVRNWRVTNPTRAYGADSTSMVNIQAVDYLA